MKVLVAVMAALVLAPSALAGQGLRVGAVEDAAVWNEPNVQMELAKQAGFDTVRMTAQWTAGTTSLRPGEIGRLQRAALAAVARGIQPIVAIYNVGAGSTPTDPSSRAQFVEYAKTVVRGLPWVTTFIVGNEPNSNTYWAPQFDAAGGDAAAAAYEQLLAASYDAIKAIRPTVKVVGGALDSRGTDDPASSRPSHSPTTFIRDVGAVYRASGRTLPIMDIFDQHVYADNSSLPPSMVHTGSSTIASGDYPKLVSLLAKAFDGTAQKGSTLPILYGEFGVESAIPATRASAYSGAESAKAVDEATQARYYTEVFKLAQCQPNVIGILAFHVVDERALGAWQSGPYYADGSPKTSLPAIHDAAVAARAGTLATCPDKAAPAVGFASFAPDGTVTANASDATGVGKVTLLVNGAAADVKYAAPYAFSWKPKKAGIYKLEVRATDAAGNTAKTVTNVNAAHPPRGDAASPSSWVFRAVKVFRIAPSTPARPKHARAQPPRAQRPRG